MSQNNQKQKITKTFSWFLLPGNIFQSKNNKNQQSIIFEQFVKNNKK